MVIIFRAVEQEYVIDKFIKKTRLSKVKQHKYVESCNLFVFYIVSVAYGVDILTKFAFWLHNFCELYLLKAKKEEITPRVIFYSLNLIFTEAAYILKFALPGEESALTSTGQGNFNQPIVRYAAIGCISALQIYMLMKFYAVISKYTRDQKEAEAASSRSKQIRKKSKKNKDYNIWSVIMDYLDSKKDADSGNEKDEEPVATGHKKKD
ncbi:uncharacterized protein TRIADDRAFT_58943 [Trichoplax adhaerens]|uniref:TLC domain-containing protein n=1 Tax=Trichoplax adhaerens TaxID=10228 RepID=B3S439_TRIAD|nr:hypothetical protein TRIADDRAFT_58943 [Trichoplax adhaerens]EDV22571.1 hypothetical protein TRIADDRAFT_58943 [Trichoplax adhaerens]|eukprot:XP_002115115.1 hypothetical protein TRIADDRAFT_58943 [Trichoplax adhaerens]